MTKCRDILTAGEFSRITVTFVHRRDVALHSELRAHAGDADRFHWHTFTGFDGASVSIDNFGASDPGGVCLEKFGFTVDNVVATA